ncbi:hypothetical protein F8388_015962 [Cannabis sativa]|uniref:Avr9/Cf-9 rapidly elicited protein 146 n=1 Tax=Cannabis sativa TaxID=3483 RepID=A0A7J6EXT7_CANSA|nr:hypothetical protein F8388_015962 [Cannabis sativa]KAF4363247.1 hypothetical protein G4B88_016001 [Cannabis sativa]
METNPPPPPSSSTSTPLIPRKLSNAVRLIMFMIQKGMSIKRKRLMILIPDMMERGKVLGKSFNDLMIRHNTALGCSSHDVRMSFVSPRDYEFSCSSTPPHRIYSADRGSTNGSDDEFPVDKAAEEFIQRFYRELLLQKLNLARETTATVRFG